MTDNERRQRARGAELRFSVPPDPRLGGRVRHELISFAKSQGIDDADVADFIGAVGEAVANAIEHAHTEQPIEIAAWVIDDRLFASVHDRGVGFAPSDRPPVEKLPDVYAERGRGLPIMRRYSEVFSVRSVPGEGTRVTLGRHVNQATVRQVHHCA